MRKIFSENNICRIFSILAGILFMTLFVSSFLVTGYNSVMLSDEYIDLGQGDLWHVILKGFFLMIFWGILSAAGKKASRFCVSKRKRNLVLLAVCLLALLFGIYWGENSHTAPQSDALRLLEYARQFNEGNFEGLQKGEYMSLCPQQLGLVTFLRVFLKFFGYDNYHAYQRLQAGLLPVLIFAGCMIVRELSGDDRRAEFYYLWFSLTCFPMYVYTCMVYGDFISIPFLLLGIWGFLSLFKKFAWWKLALTALCLGICVELKQNMVIAVIAVLIVCIFKMLGNRKLVFGGIGLVILITVWGMSFAVKGIYRDVTPADAVALPAFSYIVMGFNDDGKNAGWNNFYTYIVAAECDYDLEAERQVLRRDFKQYIKGYIKDPGYMIRFFGRKMNQQWNAPMYQCISMNNRVVGEQSGIVRNIYDHGIIYIIIEKYMKLMQMSVYGCVLFLLGRKSRQGWTLEKYVLLIAVFGGFLFTMIWEAKTRYIFPYLMMAIPYLALGINEIAAWLDDIKKVLRKHHSS